MLLSVNEVSKSFGADVVIERASFAIKRREKIALLGRNGTGKTTLLNIIIGSLEPDKGGVHLARGARVGILRQESSVASDRTILEEVQSVVLDQLALKARLAELEQRLESDASEDDIEEFALLHERFLEGEAYSMDHDVKSVLVRMGFPEDEWNRPTRELSGGQKTRLALARLLLEEPDLLILDEPTNHLDLQATEWLESWIKNYHGAVLIVSHDRDFLMNTVDSVIELRDYRTESFAGGFEKYVALRKERDERLNEVARRQEEQIGKLDEYVRRFMNSQRTAQARGRLKQMEKLIASKVTAPKDQRGIGASIKASKRSGDIVAECRGLSFGYDGCALTPALDWTVRWGERWGVVGENGSGKSTLIKTLVGKLRAVGGSARLGSSVELGYFAQQARFSDTSMSPLEFVCFECGLEAGAARDLLGRFLIEGDDVFRPIKTLSGGEKNKLALAALCHLSPNLLVLDEPTNHLDMPSREALAAALEEYGGTLILVSHDRWLLRRLVNHTLDVKRTGIATYPGSYDEYHKKTRAAEATSSKQRASSIATSHLSQREVSKQIERLKIELADAEKEVGRIEALVSEREALLAAPKLGEDFVELARSHSRAQAELDLAIERWSEIGAKIDELASLQG